VQSSNGKVGERLFEPLGIGETEEAVYRALLRRGEGSVAYITETTAVAERRVRHCLGALEAKGLVTRSGNRAGVYIPAPPESAIELLVLHRQEELEHVRLAAKDLAEEAGNESPRGRAGEMVELVTGGDALESLNTQLLMGAQREILAFSPPPLNVPDDGFTKMKLGVLRRGVKIRVIYTPDALELPGMVGFIEAVRHDGEETRVAPELPMWLLIVDRQVAFLPAFDDGVDIDHDHVLVRPSALLSALIALFERVWTQSVPFEPTRAGTQSETAGDPVDFSADESRVLALLGAGLQDAAIAHQLTMGHRTVQRHVRHIMEVLDTRTRFQTGIEAHRRGLVGSSPASAQI